jgi:TPR repeat protein
MYDSGQGVPQDDAEALKWYHKSAEQGNDSAQRNLGLMYAKGQGVPLDYVLAYMWFNLAASQGDENGKKGRDIAAKSMTREQIAEAQRLAREWKPK